MDSPHFNTDFLQTYPNYFYDPPDNALVKKNNNIRYKFFRQNHFTAGDEDQFLEFWDTSNPVKEIHRPILNPSIMIHPNVKFQKYRNLCVHDILNTYHYISDKFKKGIFLKIINGEGRVFLPFSKIDYQNEWSEKIMTNPKTFKTVFDLMEYTAKVENFPFVRQRIHKNVKSWYGNNGLVRLEFPISEGDSGVNMIQDMFATLIHERILPSSTEIFINKRDFPLLKKDDTESYNSFFGSRTKLLSHLYPKYAPILSMVTSDSHADIPIPTWEDWCRIAYWHDGRLFGKEFRRYPRVHEFDAIPWEDRMPTAVFRGASTGLGTKLENNIRLQFAAESVKQIKDSDNIPFLDAGITKWNLRPRKHPNYPYLETIIVEEMPFGLAPPKSPLEQARYKYILHLPGHSEAYRLSLELYSGSVILYYPCEYYLWYFRWLKPYVHYVPLDGTVDDLYQKIKWCKENDDQCKEIVKNARTFAETYLSRNGVLDYLQSTLWELYKMTGPIQHAQKNMRHLNAELYSVVKNKLSDSFAYFQNNQLLDDIHSFYSSDASIKMSKDLVAVIFHYFGQKIYKDLQVVKEGKNTTLAVFEFANQKYAIKKSRKTWKEEEKFQTMCGYLYINEAQKLYPNFVYTYDDYYESGRLHIITDYIEGPTMEEFLTAPDFCFSKLIDIYLYLSLTLYDMQEFCGFVHMDLFPWNIIIKRSPCKMTFKTNFESITFENSDVPFIIDYGKSHFVYENTHYYNTNPFYLCRLQDIISIVFSSLYVVLEKHKLKEFEIKKILQIMNFFSHSEYTNKTVFVNLNQTKSFLKKHKKFSMMLGEPKLGLENKSPLDFFHFLVKNKFPFNINISHNSLIIPEAPLYNFSSPFFYLKNKSIEHEMRSALMLLQGGDLVLSLRSHLVMMEQIWGSIPTLPEERYLYIWNAHRIFQNVKEFYHRIEKEYAIKVWENYCIDDFLRDYPSPEEWKDTIDPNYFAHTSPPEQLPNYPTHTCARCLVPKGKKKGNHPRLHKYIIFQIISLIRNDHSHDFFSIYQSICYQSTIDKFIELKK